MGSVGGYSRRSPSGIVFADVGIGIYLCGVGGGGVAGDGVCAERVPADADGVGPGGVYSDGYASAVPRRGGVGGVVACSDVSRWCGINDFFLTCRKNEGQEKDEEEGGNG